MTIFKVALACVIAIQASAHEVESEVDSDVTSLLHAQMKVDTGASRQAKLATASAEELVDSALGSSGGYSLAETLACATKEVASHVPSHTAFNEPATPAAAFPQEQLQSIPSTPEAELEDPPWASTLRAVLYFMIALIVCDGIRRGISQTHQTCNATISEDETSAFAAEPNQVVRAVAEETDIWGCTALHNAAAKGSLATAKELLERGANADALDANEETPLHFAARAGSAPICELLLGAGGKINAVNVKDETPWVVAGRANQGAACKLLADRGAGVAGMADEQLPPLVVNQLILKVFAGLEA
jgi:hypothetical protein